MLAAIDRLVNPLSPRDSRPCDNAMNNASPRVAAVVYNPIKVDLPALREAVISEAAAAGWGGNPLV